MLFILIYAVTGWKIKRGNRDPELWNVWKRSAWMEAGANILNILHHDMLPQVVKDNELTYGHLLLWSTLILLRYGALILLYKGWKRYPVKDN